MSGTAASVETWSGKDRADENFPVGSALIRPDLRRHVHAFYAFARNADDIADSAILQAADKIARLDAMEAVLLGTADEAASPSAAQLRKSLAETGTPAQHSRELLVAFRRDATKLRYANWDELYDYCRYSAMPVGRHVLDLHGEDAATHAPSDALCTALQVLNHLQDCAKDFRALDRCYLPEDWLAANERRGRRRCRAGGEPRAAARVRGTARARRGAERARDRAAAADAEPAASPRDRGDRRALAAPGGAAQSRRPDRGARGTPADGHRPERAHRTQVPAMSELRERDNRSDYEAVAALVRESGTSFYRGMRVLPKDRRAAMYALYAFCRMVDDIADGPEAMDAKRAALDAWRARIDALYAGATDDAVTRVLAAAVPLYGLRREDFLAIVDGMQMDAEAPIVAPALKTLDLYCDRVAAAVGRLSVRIFGDASPAADRVANALGRALQLTNILRDLVEDAERGRLYLPREWLEAAHVPADPAAALAAPGLPLVCARTAALAHNHFDQAARGDARLRRAGDAAGAADEGDLCRHPGAARAARLAGDRRAGERARLAEALARA